MSQILKENEYLRKISENVIQNQNPKTSNYSYNLNQSPRREFNSSSTSICPDSEIYKRKYYHKRQDTKVKDILYSTMSKAYMSPDDRKRVEKVESVVRKFIIIKIISNVYCVRTLTCLD